MKPCPRRQATDALRRAFACTFGRRFLDPPCSRETGTILDLSLWGCRVDTTTTVHPSLSMEVRIHVPDLEWPLMIDGATVQWVRGQTFGLGFMQVRETERERLRQVIERLAADEED